MNINNNESYKSTPVITIDGPSAAGKGTLCKALAEILQWNLLDSGAIYRLLAFMVLKNNINIHNIEQILMLLNQQNFNVSFLLKNRKINIFLADKDVSQLIRSEIIGHVASKIATYPKIREEMLHRQRIFRIAPGLIADGRDMGTIVFPDALIKIFLNASDKVRAYRRMQQLQKIGFNVNLKQLLTEIKKRDFIDINRSHAPLVAANNALILDSTDLSINEMIHKASVHINKFLKL